MKMTKNNFLGKTVGVIDVGSNSVRLMLTDGVFFNKSLITTRLGEGLSCGLLQQESINRTVNAVNSLYAMAIKSGAIAVYAFATAAVREAENGSIFLDAVYKSCKLKVEVISSDLEAELGLLGALKNSDGGIIDVGGASSEIAYQKDRQVVYKKSVSTGAVKVKDAFNLNKQLADEFLAQKVSEYGKTVVGNYCAVGGTATSLATICLGLKKYDPKKTDGCYISTKKLESLVDYLYSTSPQEIANLYDVGLKRAEIIAGGANIILNICKYLKIDGITVSEKDNLEGYYYHLKGSYGN